MFVNTRIFSGRTSEEPAAVVIMRELTGDWKLVGAFTFHHTHQPKLVLPSNAEAGLIPGQK